MMKNSTRWVMSCVVATTVSGFSTMVQAQSPASTGSPKVSHRNQDNNVNPQGGALALSVLYDSLFVVDGQSYDASNGDAWAGRSVFGDVYDLRLADDFLVFDGGFTITKTTADYLTFSGGNPVSVAVRIYPGDGTVPGEVPIHEHTVTGGDIGTSGFTDTIFGFIGMRIVTEGFCMPLGAVDSSECPYWITIQPSHTGTAGDWYYYCRDTTLNYLDPTAGRDGELGLGGYGTTTWTGMDVLGFGGGYGSMKLEGHVGRITLHALDPGIAGQTNRLQAHGCNPGARIQLFYSLSTGTTTVANCPGVCLNLRNAISAGTQVADGNGVATWSGPVGAGMRGRTGYHQVVDLSTCCVSPLMVWTYPN